MQGVGGNRKDDGKKKGGLKVHILTDIHFDSAQFVKISEAKRHDKTFLKDLVLSKGSMVVFDKAYNHYHQFAKWSDTENGIKSQVWVTLIAHLLLNVLKRKHQSNKAFSTIAALVRMHLAMHLDLILYVSLPKVAELMQKNQVIKTQLFFNLNCFRKYRGSYFFNTKKQALNINVLEDYFKEKEFLSVGSDIIF